MNASMATARHGRWAEFTRGFVMPLDAARLIFGRGKLLRLAVLPMLLTLAATVLTLWAGLRFGQGWLDSVWHATPACDDCSWYLWLWTRVSSAAWHLTWIAGVLALSAVSGLLTSRLAMFALMDALAKQILDHLRVTGTAAFAAQSTVVQVTRAVKRGLVLLCGYLVLGILSLIPGAALITTPAGFVWTVAWLYVDTCSYALQWVGPARLADIRALAAYHPPLTAGFVVSSSALQLIPFVGFAATPIAVGGACLYVASTCSEDAAPAPITLAPAA